VYVGAGALILITAVWTARNPALRSLAM
jgi:hypothetical protein